MPMFDKDTPEVKEEERELDGILPEGIDRRKFLAASMASLFGGAAGCLGGNGTGGTDDQTGDEGIIRNTIFRNAWKAEPHYATAYMGIQKGFWAERNIAPPNVRAGFGSGDTAKRVGNGREEFGMGGFSAQVPAFNQGLDLKLIGNGRAITQLALIYRKDRMDSPTDLDGKTVVTQDPYGRNVWPLYAQAVDAPENVKTKFAEEAAATALLNKGEADAVWGFFADLRSFQENVDAEIGVEPLYKHLKLLGYTLIANGSFMEENDESFEYTVRVLEGYSEAGKWTVLNPDEALEIMKTEVNSALQVSEDEVLMDLMKAGIGAVNLTDGIKNNGFAYIDKDVTENSLSLVGEALGMDNLPTADEAGAWDIQDAAQLAQFSSDEWNQMKEWAQPYTDILLG